MYDPTNAKFISEDPLGFEAEGTNLSAYVLNNPVNYTDPYGEDLYSVLNTVDRGAAGFADVITKPLSPLGLDSTTIRAKLYGELATRNHDGTAFHVGQGVGAVTLLVAGFNTPQALGNLGWAGKGLVALEVGHTGYGAYESTRNIIEGCATPLDALSFLPLLGVVGKGAKNASKLDELDDAVKGIKNTDDVVHGLKYNLPEDDFVSRANVRQLGTEISESPVATETYSRLREMGVDIELDFANAPLDEHGNRIVGLFTGGKIELYMQNSRDSKQAVEFLVHEGLHAERRFKKGLVPRTQHEEYLAFRRQAIFREGKKPTLDQRREIWKDVQKLYPNLETGNIPNFLKNR